MTSFHAVRNFAISSLVPTLTRTTFGHTGQVRPMKTFFAAMAAMTLRPLRPVHLRARRGAEGVRLSWIRRARRDGDAWEPAEIPLDEAEAYAVTLFSASGAPLRTLRAETQQILYADEAQDFGGPQRSLDVAVAQLGTVAGPGPAHRARIPVRSA